jgi:hypothetical protein
LRSHGSFLRFYQIRERKAGTQAEQQRSIPARQWERVMDFMSLAVPLFAFASR